MQAIEVDGIPDDGVPKADPDSVLVHGDFGPNNVLLDPGTFAVTGLLDWEFAHIGRRIEDLAWCEWIVRTHHPTHRDAMGEFFAGYGGIVAPWHARQAAMIRRCLELEAFCRRWDAGSASIRVWASRVEATAAREE